MSYCKLADDFLQTAEQSPFEYNLPAASFKDLTRRIAQISFLSYKVEGTMIWRVGTNEVLASNMTFTRLKVKQEHFETTILILRDFFVFLYG